MKYKTQVIFCIVFFSLLVKTSAGQDSKNKKEIQCADSLWGHVYNSSRLMILERCIQVTGVVMSKKHEDDGDIHILLKLDSGQENRLVKGNYSDTQGCLVVEIICADASEKDRAKYSCTDYVNHVHIPKIGKHVRVVGSYVMDTHNNWAEIHPVTKIKVIKE